MARQIDKTSDVYKRKLAYIQKWNKTQKKITITFNPVTEKDLWDKLNNVDAKATYIKNLIRADMYGKN